MDSFSHQFIELRSSAIAAIKNYVTIKGETVIKNSGLAHRLTICIKEEILLFNNSPSVSMPTGTLCTIADMLNQMPK